MIEVSDHEVEVLERERVRMKGACEEIAGWADIVMYVVTCRDNVFCPTRTSLSLDHGIALSLVTRQGLDLGLSRTCLGL